MKTAIKIITLLIIISQSDMVIGQVDQVIIDRISAMPNQPHPYNLRDWKAVAQQYDSFVYDLNKTGEFLPLIFLKEQGTNYPENPSFGLNTYVGSFNQSAGEAINILPSLVSATLAGIDKSSQDGHNWILYSQDFFNHKNGENIYLNNVGARSGNDWWYDMMPNVFFYQLYDLYGDVGQAEFQFGSVADRMLGAVKQMGGSDTPWQRPSMNYRAWNFVNGKPLASGVIEPEAAGAFAWLLYHAYKETGEKEYLKGAEWSLEFLTNLGNNPSYELQLPYGAYVAAKINAEVGTNYDIKKLIFWIFNRGPLRGWGTIVGNWGGLDVSGLVGEANDQGNDYAFQLNGLQHAAALVPLVRYDKRFAKAIAKWLVNLANATRLMYPGFLPANRQDASDWSSVYDPDGVIGYEALREKLNGLSPVSTGDALKGQWAATNLSLYSSSSLGYLGSLITKTNVEMILQIDLLKTDFFSENAFPSFLLFNPFSETKVIQLSVGSSPVDIYDAISEDFILMGVSGEIEISMPGDAVLTLVYVPAGSQLSTLNNKLLADATVIDYNQTKVAYNRPPRIQAFAADKIVVIPGDTINLYTKALDLESKDLLYNYHAEGGLLSGDGPNRKWILPEEIGVYSIQVTVTDQAGQTDSATLQIQVVAEINFAPQIIDIVTDELFTTPVTSIQLTCLASDANGDSLAYSWSADAGELIVSLNTATWKSPAQTGIYQIKVVVTDEAGASAEQSISILVFDYVKPDTANLIAYYPFDSNADDLSGNELHGVVQGARLTDDRNGHSSGAYFFDGINDHISVPNTDILNFTKGITLSLWVEPNQLPDKETFILSHGSWQNRFKLSIIPDKNLRWTLKNTQGQVQDLDSKTKLEVDRPYYVTATYDGHFMTIYIDGKLESFAPMTGDINKTTFDLEIAQILPEEQAYNFGGVLDEISIYDYALSPATILHVYEELTTSTIKSNFLTEFINIYPNPADEKLFIDVSSGRGVNFHLSIFNQQGQIQQFRDYRDVTLVDIDVHGFTPGLYYIVIQTKEDFFIKKFVKK